MKIFAHRGASYDAPENTLAAFRLGWRQHADGAELDVRLSRDGAVVVCHDASTKRTTGLRRIIAKTEAAGLRDLPLLGEVIAEMPFGRELLVEIKSDAKIVTALSNGRWPVEQVSFLCFDRRVLAAAKRAMPHHRCLLNVAPFAYTARRLIALGRGFDGVSLGWHRSIHRDLVAQLHAAGLRVAVWTVDDPDIGRLARDSGVDILMTNRPGSMRQALSIAHA